MGLSKSISGLFAARGAKEQAAYEKGKAWGTEIGNHIEQIAAQRFNEMAVDLLGLFKDRLSAVCNDPRRDPQVAAKEALSAFAEEISEFEREMLDWISSNLSEEMAFADRNGLHEVMAALIAKSISARSEFLETGSAVLYREQVQGLIDTLGRTDPTHSDHPTNHLKEPHGVNMKTFLLATARLATALFLAGLALLLTIALYSWGQDAYESSEARPYESIKEWSSDLRSTLGIQLNAKTKVINGRLLLSVVGDGYPPYLSDRRLAERNQKAHLTISFLDRDGFRVFSKPIQIAEFTNIVGDKGENIGLRAEAQDHVSLDDYKRFQQLQVEWTLVTKVPPESQEVKTDTGSLDHCAPNLTQEERLRRLSKHGELRETGRGSYSAGGRYVYFSYDGSLSSCQ